MFLTGFGKTTEAKDVRQIHARLKMRSYAAEVFWAVLPGRVFNRALVHLNLHTYTPRQLLIRARNGCDVCSGNRPNSRKGNSKASHVKAESEHRWSKRRSNFTGAEVKVLLQDVDVSILFHNGYINAIELSAYLFIHLHLQCSCSPFIYFRTSRCLRGTANGN